MRKVRQIRTNGKTAALTTVRASEAGQAPTAEAPARAAHRGPLRGGTSGAQGMGLANRRGFPRTFSGSLLTGSPYDILEPLHGHPVSRQTV